MLELSNHQEYIIFFYDAKQALIPSSLARQALDRDNRCIFSGVSSTGSFAVTWIFPFEGFTVKVHYFITTEQPFFDCQFQQLSDDPWLEWTYGISLIVQLI